ncbi:DUF4407 domain-containing protein [Kitasatospora sp. NPDC093679]|uniref:DUF4407 domain-containing protein n=1 Tax=Kitasatospora sp. NPDC093679 TaxID=3154983 RepID=UPI0034322A7F
MRILPTRTTSSTDPGPGSAGRRLRVLTGVDEELLARVRTERARYSALGAVMVCTAAIGGFSMFFALEEIIGGVRPWFVLAALGWAVFVLCLDRWLVSSSGGSRWRTRASVLAPRLVIACFFGFLIAEPIVLRIFEPSVLSVVAQDRQQHLDHLRQELLACNRPPGAADASQPAGADCTDRDLGLSGELGAVSRKLDQLRSQADQLRTGIAEDQKTLAGLRRTVNEECNGTEGRGLTGRAGNGPACQYDQEAVRNFEAAHPVGDQQRQLAELDRAITEASKGRAGTESDFQNLLVRRIDERLKQEDQPGAPVGLGDRFDALFALAGRSGFIGAASWLVRVFFVLIDCMPVLVKFFSGATAYDRLVENETVSAERIHTDEMRVREEAASERLKTELHEIRAHAARRRMEIDLQTRRHANEQETRQQQAVDELWERKLGERRRASSDGGGVRPAAAERRAAEAPAPVQPAAEAPTVDSDALERLVAQKLAEKRAARGQAAPAGGPVADTVVPVAAPAAERPGGRGPVVPVPWSLLKPSAEPQRHAGVNGHQA